MKRKPAPENRSQDSDSSDSNAPPITMPPFRSFRERIESILKQHGPDSFIGTISSSSTNEAAYLFQKFMRTIIGTNNIVTVTSPDWPFDAQSAIYQSLGQNSISPPIGSLRSADLILILQGGPPDSHLLVSNMIEQAQRDNQAKVILFDPETHPLAARADLHFRVGSEGESDLLRYFLHMAHVFGATDREFVWRDNGGFQKLIKEAKTYTAEAVSRKWSIPPETLQRAVRLVTQKRRVSIIINSRAFPDVQASRVVKDALNLILALGHLGTAGRGLWCASPFENPLGIPCMGSSSSFLPGLTSIFNESSREWYAQTWSASIPLSAAESSISLLERLETQSTRALICLGDSPFSALIPSDRLQSLLSNLDMLASASLVMDARSSFFWPLHSPEQTSGTKITAERLIVPFNKCEQPQSTESGTYQDWEIVSLWIDSFLDSPGTPSLTAIQGEMIACISSFIELTPSIMESESRYFKPFTEECVDPEDSDFEIEDIQKLKFHLTPSFKNDLCQGDIPISLKRIPLRNDSLPTLRIHPETASDLGVHDHETRSITMGTNTIVVLIRLDDTLAPNAPILEYCQISACIGLTGLTEQDTLRIRIGSESGP